MSESPLFRPLEVAGLTLKNRLVMPPMGSGLADVNGFVTDRLRDYYVRRAAGGIGTITIEATVITPETAGVGPETRIHGPEFVPGLASVAAAVKEHDVTVGLQLWHPGRQTKLGRPVAPSPIPLAKRGEVPRALTVDEIDEIHARYAAGAAHSRDAGFDFVEVHGAHCYLPCEFLSPVANVRDDEYGGSLENRARFAIRVVQAMREAVGPDFPIFYRISGEERAEGGFTIDDTVEVSRWLVAVGVDCVSVSAGSWYALHYTIPPMFMARGCLVPYARRIKREVDVPVMTVGRLDDVALAESVLDDGDADLIGIGRALIADADWPVKVREGRVDEIRPCIACNACVDRVSDGREARCAVSSEVGREGTWQVKAAERPRRVVVVGGGPAGMEAARVAGLRGHHVSLYEREPELGGKMPAAAAAPSKGPVITFRDYAVRAVGALGVDVHTGTDVTPDLLAEIDPEVVVVATGAESRIFPIPGIDLPHVPSRFSAPLPRSTCWRCCRASGRASSRSPGSTCSGCWSMPG